MIPKAHVREAESTHDDVRSDVTVTVVPPATFPTFGETDEITGSRRKVTVGDCIDSFTPASLVMLSFECRVKEPPEATSKSGVSQFSSVSETTMAGDVTVNGLDPTTDPEKEQR